MTLAADQHLPHFIMWGSHVFYQLYGFNFSGSNQETWIAHKWLSPAGVGRRFTHLSSLRVLLQCSSTKSWRMRSLVVCERRGSGSEGRGERRGQGGGQGRWRGKKENMLRSVVITKHLLKLWTTDSLENKSRFTGAFCQLLNCGKREQHVRLAVEVLFVTEWVPVLYLQTQNCQKTGKWHKCVFCLNGQF